MKIMKTLSSLLVLFTLTATGFAQQEFSGGFRAGVNFARFQGPSETDANGEDLEEFGMMNGFHVGATFNYSITDLFGVRGEIVYSQRGTEYSFEGSSYWIFNTTDGDKVYSTNGNRQVFIDITQSYIDLPMMVYGRVGRLEFTAGVTPSFLISSRGAGDVTYSGITTAGSNVAPFTAALDFNYFKDTYVNTEPQESTRNIDGKIVLIPESLGADYQEIDTEDKLFHVFDLGVNAGLAFFLNEGLYLGGRLTYGLLDITRETRDVSRVSLDDNLDFVFRDDFDRNLNIQVSVGFLF